MACKTADSEFALSSDKFFGRLIISAPYSKEISSISLSSELTIVFVIYSEFKDAYDSTRSHILSGKVFTNLKNIQNA